MQFGHNYYQRATRNELSDVHLHEYSEWGEWLSGARKINVTGPMRVLFTRQMTARREGGQPEQAAGLRDDFSALAKKET